MSDDVLGPGDWGVFQAIHPAPEIVRYIVRVDRDRQGAIFVITSSREKLAAEREQREPIAVGFRARYLIRRATEAEIAEEQP